MKRSAHGLALWTSLLALAACASQVGAPRPAALGPLSADQASSTVEVDVRASVDSVFAYIVRPDTPARDLRAYCLIAGVRGGQIETDGGWDHAGARRTVTLDDGSTLKEEILAFEPSARFAYRVHELSASPNRDLIREGRGDWTFAPNPDGSTHVAWTYTFTARSCGARPAVRALVGGMFHAYMEQGMTSMKRHIEGASQTMVSTAPNGARE